MQTDWGGEYQKLNSFFQRIGILHHVSCPHAHQQNGAAERKHRHIVEVGLSILSHASMPLKLWDEAFLTATFLINRLPTKVIHGETPLERLYGQKPDYSSLRTFGCACWPNLRPFNARKLQFRSKKCVFLGYSHMHKGFKCLDVKEGRVYISLDVVFDEEVYPFSTMHPNAGAQLQSEIQLLPSHFRNPSNGDNNTFDQFDNGSLQSNRVIPEPTGHETVTGENLGENLEQTDQNLDSNDKYFMQQGGFPFLVGTGGNLGVDSARIRSPDAWIFLGFATARSRCTGSVHHHTKLATCPPVSEDGGTRRASPLYDSADCLADRCHRIVYAGSSVLK
jgi:hypothetical protein